MQQVDVIDDDAAMQGRWTELTLASLLTCVMLTTFIHPYLFRRDEPREAEIARETLVDNHWVTPYLCGLPFLEKPPLYYNLVAAAYAVTGSITPPVARFVSIAFGVFTLLLVLAFGYRWGGARRGWLAALILIGMPEFYKYSHLIVLDIAVMAFVVLALTAFVWWYLEWTDSPRKMLCIFYAAAAGAFLTKGAIGVFHIVLVVTSFCLITRRWSTFARLFHPLALLLFLAPVGIWVLLYYREGGIAYLHEHFVNNIAGRLLGVRFRLPGVDFPHTDVGTPRGGVFYFRNLLRLFGIAAVTLPLILWTLWRGRGRERDAEMRRALRDRPPSVRELPLLLVLWGLLPLLVLSFSANKETSYVLPSCAGIALLTAWWLDEHVLPSGTMEGHDVGWFAVILPAVVMNWFGLQIDVTLHRIVGALFLAAALFGTVLLFWRRRLTAGTFALLGAAVCLIVLGNSPNREAEKWGFGRTLSDEIWARTGQAELYLYRPDDVVRGCVPFYRNRLTREIDRSGDLEQILAAERRVFVLMRTQVLASLQTAGAFSGSWRLQSLPDLDERHRYVLVSNARD